MRNPSFVNIHCLMITLLCVFTSPGNSLASAPNKDCATNPAQLPAPPLQQQTLTTAQIKSLEDGVAAAKDLGALAKLGKQIAFDRASCALDPATAKKLIERILDKERKLTAPDSLEIAHTLCDLADCYPLEEMKKAILFRREALAIAIKKSPAQDPFILKTRNALVRQLVLTHATREQIIAMSPLCPHCHTSALVVPVFGLMPYLQKDYGYGFVNGSCSPDRPDWYCRKCKGSYFPYSTKAIVMDQKPH